MGTSRGREPDGTAVVRALFAAYNEGRLDDLLRLVGTGAVWEPATRPSRDFYLGKSGTLGLLTDLRAVYGKHRIECHEFEQLDDGQIKVTGALIRTEPGTDPPVVAFSTVVTIRDGRVVRLVSQPGDLHGQSPSESGAASP